MPGHICIQSWDIPPSTPQASRYHPINPVHMPGHICIQSWDIPPSTPQASRYHPHQVVHTTLLRHQGATTVTLASILATILHPSTQDILPHLLPHQLLVGGPAPGVTGHLHLHLLQSVSLQTSLSDCTPPCH